MGQAWTSVPSAEGLTTVRTIPAKLYSFSRLNYRLRISSCLALRSSRPAISSHIWAKATQLEYEAISEAAYT